MFFCDKHYLQRFSAEPNKKKWKKKGKWTKVCFFLFPVAATVTGGSLLNAGNRLVCFSLSDCHTTLFVVPFWTVAYRIKACMKVCRLVKTRDVLNYIPYAHTHTHRAQSLRIAPLWWWSNVLVLANKRELLMLKKSQVFLNPWKNGLDVIIIDRPYYW